MVKKALQKKEGCNIQVTGVIFKRVAECLLRKPSSETKCIVTSKVKKL